MGPVVASVQRSDAHTLRKFAQPSIRLRADFGVDGDAHAGATVQHESRVARDATQPNRRQVHLIAAELHEELGAAGFTVGAGDMGENVTTRGIDLLALAAGTRLRLGPDAIVEITGLRTPCKQLDSLQPGLMEAVLDRAADGSLVRRAGVMGVVVTSGEVHAGDAILVTAPPPPHRPLEPV